MVCVCECLEGHCQDWSSGKTPNASDSVVQCSLCVCDLSHRHTRLAQEKLKRWPPLFLVLYSVVCGVLKLLDFALQEGVRGTTGLAFGVGVANFMTLNLHFQTLSKLLDC